MLTAKSEPVFYSPSRPPSAARRIEKILLIPERRLGIDLGGTKIEVAILDPDRTERFRRRVPTPRGDYDGTLRAIAALVAAAETECGRAGTIGIGTPGALRADGTIKNANSVVLNGKPLKRDLERVLARSVAMTNDANCFILSEASDGAARGARVAFGVILGTGVGGGIFANGAILEGPNAIAGEWGHNPLPWPSAGEITGPMCYCGKRGCLETYLSGPALTRLKESGVADPMSIYADRLARGLTSVINVLDPDVIVLGGGVSNIDELYKSTPPLLLNYVFSDVVATRLTKAHHGDSSGVRGAALLSG